MVSMELRYLAAYGGKSKPVDNKPGKITDLFINNFSKTLNWQPSTDGGSPITGYTILAASTGETAKTWSPGAAVRSQDLSSLTNKKKYSGTIAAVNKNGVGATAAFSGELGLPDAPAAPALRGASGNSISVTLQRAAVDSDLTLTYDVQYRKVGDPSWVEKTGVNSLYDVTPTVGGTQYEVQGRTVSVNGASGWSPSLTVTTPDTVCRPPVLTKIVPIDFGGVVEWTYNGTVEPIKFRIKAAGPNTVAVDVSSPETDGSILGLQNGQEYTVTVTAFSADGVESAPSNAVKFTPVAPPIPAPTLKTAVGGDGQITFSFTGVTMPDGHPLKHYSWQAVSVANRNETYSDYIPAGIFDNVHAIVPNDLDWDLTVFTVSTLDEVSDPSNKLTVHTERPIAPYKPHVNGAQIDSGNAGFIDVSFSPGINNVQGDGGPGDITAWQVRVTDMADSKNMFTYDITDGAARTYRTPKVVYGTWFVDVRAQNKVGWSAWSDRATVVYNPTDVRPFTSDKPFDAWSSATYNYAIFDPGNDPSKGWETTWACTFTDSGKTLSYDILLIGAGGGGKGQTLTLGKGGNGGGGQMIVDQIATPSSAGFSVTVSIGGSTAIDPKDSVLSIGGKNFTALSGKSASNATDAVGQPKTTVPSTWQECKEFTWLLPDTLSVGGVAESGKQGYPDGLWMGNAGAGTKTNLGGKGREGVVIVRWPK